MTKRNGFRRTSLLALLTGGALAIGGALLGHPLLLCGPPPARAAELSLGGNATSLLVGTGQSGSWSWRIQEDLRLKVAGRGPGVGSWQGEFVLSSGTTAGSSIPGGGEGGTGSGDSFRVDRLFLEWDDGPTRVTLGRQRIAWGVGYAFSPLDQFNPPNPLDPSAPRLGADALVLRRSTGDLSYLSAVGVLPQTGGTSPAAAGANPAAGAIWGFHAARTDLALSYLADPARALHQWGLAAKGDLGVGWHLEGVYQKPWAGAEDGRWLGVLGLDYSFLDGQLVCLWEYFYDGTGEPDPARYDYTLLR
ncbi:MAG: hypothetical protein QJR13_07260 [Bacillota bacterium]|nr:hypothetical protein [Bacillota bacterium]